VADPRVPVRLRDRLHRAALLDGGRRVAVGSRAGWVRLWSSATGKPVSPPLAAHQGAVVALAISPDGRTLAFGGSDGFVRLFDLGSQQPLDARLPVAANTATTPIFVRNGAYLFAITATGRAYRWDLRPSTWDHRACEVAGRQLTRTEWSQVLPDRNHDPACLEADGTADATPRNPMSVRTPSTMLRSATGSLVA
jgi:WD40 repeat protein